MSFVGSQRSTFLGIVVVCLMPGCATNAKYASEPAEKKARVEKSIASSVAKANVSRVRRSHYNVAMNSLLEIAKNQQQSGDYAAAAASIERALRIQPKSTEAYYHLAEVRMQQARFGEAEQLAKKAMSYVNFGSNMRNNQFKAKLWHLISEARTQSDNKSGAESALIKAHQLEQRVL
ncbi:MAG: tetratricopeptide repeat protein [Pseudomonadales bacterium]|nr:tetratricopeptide repeat protein [Pseudomonadales bacterium]